MPKILILLVFLPAISAFLGKALKGNKSAKTPPNAVQAAEVRLYCLPQAIYCLIIACGFRH